MSNSYKRYDLAMPPYLQNRPRHIVQHCLEKIDLAKSIPSHHVISKGEGQFEVYSQRAMLDMWYKVSFGGHDATPSCTCKEWQRTRLPCKHMFAIFRHQPDWSFDNLSEAYRTSPFFILDEDLIFPINNTLPVTDFPKEERMTATCSSEEIDNLLIADKENLPLPKEERMTGNSEEFDNLLNVYKLPIPSRFKKTVAAQCRELMNQAKSLTYIVDDTDILVQVRKSLEKCQDNGKISTKGIQWYDSRTRRLIKTCIQECAKGSVKEQTSAKTFTSCNTQE